MKVLKILCVVIIMVVSFIGGKFYMTVYAANYQCDMTDTSNTLQVNYKEDKEITNLKVGTYNIKSMNYGESVDKFKEDIEDLDLDVIALQEVDKNAFRSGNQDMMAQLAKATDYPYYYFFTTMWIIDGYYGLGILSKYPILDVSSELLPNSLVKEPRILAKATIQVASRNVTIYNTHVTYENNIYRVKQLAYIQNHVTSKQQTILMGDFNTFGMNGSLEMPDMESINGLQQYATFLSFGAPDDIFYSTDLTPIESNVKESSFSDHNLLYATFQLE